MSGGGVFISYRGDDCPGYAPLLYAELSRRFGCDLVFLDNESIPPGRDFVPLLLGRLREAAVLLVLIGRNWLTSAGPNGRRIDDPADWCRRELAEAFEVGVMVIPVLVDDVRIPLESELPAEVAALSRRQYRRLRHREASADIARLVADLVAIEPRLGRAEVFSSHGRGVVGRPPLLADAVWRVPARNPNFVGREGELELIRDRFLGSAVVAVQALRGMGGVGKTQTAIEYAHRYADDYDMVWWIEADQPALVGEQFADLSAALGLSTGSALTAGVHAVCAELRRRRRWLLVFDNAERVQDIQAMLPGGRGHVLITTRRRGLRAVGTVLDLDVFDRVDAVTLLRRQAPHIGSQEADTLAEHLGDLPLALDQAAAYLDQTGMPAAEYLQLLHQRSAELYGRGQAATHQHTIATLWSLSLTRLQQLQPEAIALLRLAAWLAPEPIPLDLLTQHPHLLPAPLDQAMVDPLRTADLIGTLADHSLIRHDGEAILLHRLVQTVIREQLPEQPHPNPLAVVLALLRAALPDKITYVAGHWPRWKQLLPHVIAAANHHNDSEPVAADDVSWLLDHAASALRVVHGPGNAFELFNRALRIRQSICNHDDLRLATTMHNLGVEHAEAYGLSDARALLERALHIRQRYCGSEHPQTADSLSWLGNVLNQLGDTSTALRMLKQALDTMENLLEPDHLAIATALNNLGWAYMNAGKPDNALDVFHRALGIREPVYGPDSPWTAACLYHVGRTLTVLGDASGSQPLLHRALSIRKASFGPEHWLIGVTLGGWGAALVKIGQYQEAIPLLEQALSNRQFTDPQLQDSFESARKAMNVALAPRVGFDN